MSSLATGIGIGIGIGLTESIASDPESQFFYIFEDLEQFVFEDGITYRFEN